MSKKHTDETYNELTVVELKELADQQGIDIPSDARKADIIEALQSSSAKTTEDKAEEKNVYLYNTSSTTEAHMTEEDHWKIKLTA